jgi:hypothetical protein
VPRSFALELVAKEPRRGGDPARLERAISDLLGGDRVAVWHAVDAGGSLHVAIIRRGRARAAFDGPGASLVRRARRDRSVDVLRVDVGEGRIVVSTGEPSLERAYAEAAGSALFDDPSFFGDSLRIEKLDVVIESDVGKLSCDPSVSLVRVRGLAPY